MTNEHETRVLRLQPTTTETGQRVLVQELSRDFQLHLHERHSEVAYDLLVDLLHRSATRDRVIQLSRERLGGIGFDEYGDEMFRQNFSELLSETDDELADAVNRMVAWLVRQAAPTHKRGVAARLMDGLE